MSIESIRARLDEVTPKRLRWMIRLTGPLLPARFVWAMAYAPTDVATLLIVADAAKKLVGPERLIPSALKSDDVEALGAAVRMLEVCP